MRPTRDQMANALMGVVEAYVQHHGGADLYEQCSNVSQTYAGDYDCDGCSACYLNDALALAEEYANNEPEEPEQDSVDKLRSALKAALRKGLHRPVWEGEGLDLHAGAGCHPDCWCHDMKALL